MTDLAEIRAAVQRAIADDRISPLFAGEVDAWLAELVDRVERAEAESAEAKSQCLICGVPFGAHGSEPERPTTCTSCGDAVQRVERAEAEARHLRAALGELEWLQSEVARLHERLRAVARYADGLHFAGRLDDERIVRAALGEERGP